MKLGSYLLLLAILLSTIFTRFYRITQYPPGLTIDEVAIGYNAHSILKTGRDEWGEFLPFSFRSSGDYKAPILVYLTVPSLKIFGLNELGVRLPVSVFSAISVFVFWLLTSRYFFSQENKLYALIATLMYTVSPWHIIYSRSGFEAVVAQTFLLLNLLFLFGFLRTGSISKFFLMVVFAFLSAISYHSTRLVVPLLNLFLLAQDWSLTRKHVVQWISEKKILFSFVVGITSLMLWVFLDKFIFGPGSTRAGMTFLAKDFDYTQVLLPVYKTIDSSSLVSFFGLLSFWFKRYLEYFSLNFYLSSGLGLTLFGQPGQGVVYPIELVLMLVAMHYLQTGQGKSQNLLTGQSSFFWYLLPGLTNSQHVKNSQCFAFSILLHWAISIYLVY
jgi:4-amino-4-deoxy-L-arabinose transferase-like glycosyltransferase